MDTHIREAERNCDGRALDQLYRRGLWPINDLVKVAWFWTNGEWVHRPYCRCDNRHCHAWRRQLHEAQGPMPPNKRMLQDIVARTICGKPFGRGKSYGEGTGYLILDGLTFHLKPKGHRANRLLLKCPACHRWFHFIKWRQHAKARHPESL